MTIDPAFHDHRAGLVDSALDESTSDEERVLAREAYRALLPMTTLSRCPFSDREVGLPFDQVDLDGPYWDSLDPVRRDPAPKLPATCLSLVGAMLLEKTQVRPAPFLALPGPGRPYVVPELLKVDGVVAVLSAIEVGPHQGLCIAYFGDGVDIAPSLRLNLWGARSYRYAYEDGQVVEGESELYDLDNEYDLEPWIAAGKVAWTAPDDPSFSVDRGADCPYLAPAWTSGPDRMQRVANGEIVT